MLSTDETTTPAWDEGLLKNPHAVSDKRGRVQRMFAAIAPSYDLNNRLHSLWMDQLWRRKAVKLAGLTPSDVVVDVACGTGDLSIAMHRQKQRLSRTPLAQREPVLPPLPPGEGRGEGELRAPLLENGQPTPTSPHPSPVAGSRPIRSLLPEGEGARGQRAVAVNSPAPTLGIDFTFEMLPIACEKSAHRGSLPIQFLNGDAQSLPLPDVSADVVSIAFGIRNVASPAVAIREFFRVLRPGGRLIILEFSLPTNSVLRGLYNFYFRKILPRTATLISGDKTGAYKYLPESVNTFIGRQQMMQMMTAAGFQQVQQHPMTFGVCICYCGVKP